MPTIQQLVRKGRKVLVDEFSAVRFNDLYKIWNIAMQYGSKSANISPLTEEQGKFKY